MMDGIGPTELQNPRVKSALAVPPTGPVAPVAAAPADPFAELDAADAALGLPPRARGLAAPADQPDFGDVYSAAWKAETIKTDAWGYREKLRREKTLEMFGALPPEYQDQVRAGRHDKYNNWQRFEYFVADAARAYAASSPDAAQRMAMQPQSLEGFDDWINSQLRAEYDEQQAVLGQEGGGFAEFLGSGARALSDPTSIAMMPLGGGSGSVLRFAAIEAGLGALGEAAVLPREFEVAKDLDLPEPDVASRLALGAVFGGALGAGIAGAPRVLAYGKARLAPVENAVRNGENQLDASAAVDAAEAQMRGDTTIVEEIGNSPDTAPSPLAAALGRGADGPLFDYSPAGNAAPQTNRVGYVFGKLIELGYPPHVSAGLVGNLMQESGPGLNTRAVGDNGNAFGMGQWNGPRMNALKAFARKKGGDPASLDIQVQFLHYELQNTERAALDRIMRAPDAASAAAIASDAFWRPGIPHKERRVAFARSLAEQFDGGAVPAWKGANIQADGGGMPDYTTTRGYTGAGQVSTASGTRVDVEYQVVDLSTLFRASGDLQPRDRSRITSDAQIADIAAKLEPRFLMPGPKASDGPPIVGPDNVIESGNGRFGAISRAYELHPDRADAYRAAIEAQGFAVPEGVQRPVLIARRTSEMTQSERVQFAIDAQDAGVAVMTATETAAKLARTLSPEVLMRFNPTVPMTDAGNGDFLRAALANVPVSERNAMFDGSGILNKHGNDVLREAMFARAWADPDIVEMFTEADAGDLRGLLDALAKAAPEWAALKADIEAGLVRPEMDVSGYVTDAVRLIATARRMARQNEGLTTANAIAELLDEVDLFAGPVAPLTTALVKKFWTKGKAAPADEVATFLTQYASDARKAGQAGGMFDAPSPGDVLRAIDRDTFADLPDDLGPIRGFARPNATPLPDTPSTGYEAGAASAEAAEVDAVIRGEIETEAQNPFGPIITDFKDWRDAALILEQKQTGEAIGALNHPDIGPISLVWGKAGNSDSSGFGLAKLVAWHPEVLDDLQARLARAAVESRTQNRIKLRSTTDNFAVSLDYDGKAKTWLLTAFERGMQRQERSSTRLADIWDGSTSPSPLRDLNTADARADQSPANITPAQADLDRAELDAARTTLAEDAGLADMEITLDDGTTANLRQFLDDLDADDEADAVVQLCAPERNAQ